MKPSPGKSAICQAQGQPNDASAFFSSDEAQLLRELREFGEEYYAALFTLDLIVIWKKKRKVIRFKDEAVAMFQQSFAAGGRVFFIGAGTSYHAALTAGFFFNNLTTLSIIPCNPDLFRSVYMNSLRSGDVLVAITQSGETKDLVDILNQVREKFGKAIRIIAVVNNENSTIPQEKAEFFLPLLCGPEIAVAATKSFSAQLALFYLLAAGMKKDAPPPQQKLEKIKHLIDYTLKTSEEDVTEVMLKFFLKPSIHILGTSLIGLAREGALKIREVVLNHAEGYDAAEFKHGPNTILGKNTLYSFLDMENLLADMADFSRDLLGNPAIPAGKRNEVCGRFFKWIRDFKFADFSAEIMNSQDPAQGKQGRLPGFVPPVQGAGQRRTLFFQLSPYFYLPSRRARYPHHHLTDPHPQDPRRRRGADRRGERRAEKSAGRQARRPGRLFFQVYQDPQQR